MNYYDLDHDIDLQKRLGKKKVQEIKMVDKTTTVLLLINVFLLFLHNVESFKGYQRIIEWVDHLFTIIFLVEVIYKVYLCKATLYFKSLWNWFDFIVILASATSFVFYVFNEGENLEYLIILRILRVSKFLMLLEFVPFFKEFSSKMFHALKSVGLIFIILLFYVIFISILNSYLFGGVAPELFGTMDNAIFTTFRIYTLDAWSDIPSMLSSQFNGIQLVFIKLYFASVAFVGGILGVSIVTGVFFEAIMKDHTNSVDEKLNEILKKLDSLEKGK